MWDFIKKIVGTKNDREIKRIRPYVDEINKLEPDYQRLSDGELKAKTDQFKGRLAEATATLKSELEEIQNRASVAVPEEREVQVTPSVVCALRAVATTSSNGLV